MATSERMAKRREERRAAIVAAAREFAERDGWAAVTSRRLAEAIDYTQPVVYSHFSSMDAVADAVAIEGFAELTPAMATARAEQTTERGALEAVCRAYLSYAGEHPAVYDAMFVRSTGLVFADALTPPELIAAFGELHAVVEPFGGDSETMAELLWAALHGLTLLQRTGRVPDDGEVRIRALVDRFAAS